MKEKRIIELRDIVGNKLTILKGNGDKNPVDEGLGHIYFLEEKRVKGPEGFLDEFCELVLRCEIVLPIYVYERGGEIQHMSVGMSCRDHTSARKIGWIYALPNEVQHKSLHEVIVLFEEKIERYCNFIRQVKYRIRITDANDTVIVDEGGFASFKEIEKAIPEEFRHFKEVLFN